MEAMTDTFSPGCVRCVLCLCCLHQCSFQSLARCCPLERQSPRTWTSLPPALPSTDPGKTRELCACSRQPKVTFTLVLCAYCCGLMWLYFAVSCCNTHSLLHSLTHTHTLTHTHSLTHTHTHTHSLTHSLHSLTPLNHSTHFCNPLVCIVYCPCACREPWDGNCWSVIVVEAIRPQ